MTSSTICFLCCSLSVEKYPNNRMLGRREIVDGKVNYNEAFCLCDLRNSFFSSFYFWLYLFLFLSLQPGKYVWQTYKEVYDLVVKVGNSIRSCGIEEVSLHGYLAVYYSLLIILFAVVSSLLTRFQLWEK